MIPVVFSLGSNVEPRVKFLVSALGRMRSFVNITRVSSVYESEPWGYTLQDRFLNVVAVGFTNMPLKVLFERVKRVEVELGRVERFRWGPREIDIDIVYYSISVVHTREIVIPHPYRLERDFVLLPIFEVLPNFVDPEYKVPLSFFVKRVKKSGRVNIWQYDSNLLSGLQSGRFFLSEEGQNG